MDGSSNESINAAITQLRSEDTLTQNEGVEALIRVGTPAVPSLLPLLSEENPDLRAQAMHTLAQIADPGTADAFQRGLQDADERVRAYAAQGLARINHPDALTAALATLNDAPDPLHLDMTPSVLSLGEMGLEAVPGLLDRMMDDDEDTRLRAQRALEGIISRQHGFRPGQGFPAPEAEEQVRSVWRANGNYDFADEPERRAASVSQWRQWLAEAERSG